MSNRLITFLIFFILIFFGCEDSPPTDYIPQYYVEAFLIVDEPIDGIKLMRTQPLTDTFELAKALIKNATVKIKNEKREFLLEFRDTGNSTNWSYFYPDTSIKIEPNTTYFLEILTPDGKKITGKTTTPSRFFWTNRPPDTLYYPKDSVKFTDKAPVKIRWSSVQNVLYYLIMLKCIDTLEYGKYLNPPSDEKNRRVYNPFYEETEGRREYFETTIWDAMPNIEYPIFWVIFKWFGKHKIVVYSPDFNFLRWVVQHFRSSQVIPLLSSVDGAIGVFGSASKIEAEFFLVKNQQ
ncbi:MAG: DUF4249 domain-containing protein [Ignavibacteria bacterium]|nr:DUF4249 domain-containing protein [Ignavibacteria bacterium]